MTDADSIVAAFEILKDRSDLFPFEPRYNISPSPPNLSIGDANFESLTRIPIIRNERGAGRVLRNAVWPLIPFWSNGAVPKYSTANARSENMAERNSYRHVWKRGQRCLIPVTGFYEWQVVANEKRKKPWHIMHSEQPIMSLAGLWERGRTAEGEPFDSCTIVTTAANSLMSEIHNSNFRMPVIIDPEHREQWLGGDNDAAMSLTETYVDGKLEAYPISTRINNPKYNEPDSVSPERPSE